MQNYNKLFNICYQKLICCLAFLSAFIYIFSFSTLDCKAAQVKEHDYFDINNYREVTFNAANGLNTDVINSIAQTEDGFIWIGSYTGLTRYDGSEFFHIPGSATGIYSVASLYVDRLDRVWIGTVDNGIAMEQENGTYEFWNQAKGLGSNTVHSITENEAGVIFAATTKGLSMIDNGKATTVADPRLQNNYISKVVKGRNNSVAGITKKGDVFVFKGKNLVSFFEAKGFPLQNITTIVADTVYPDVYWLGNDSNIVMKVHFSENTCNVISTFKAEGKSGINDLVQLENGSIIVATDTGVGFFDVQGNFHAFNSITFNHSVDNIMIDYEDNIWFTSSRQGVSKLTHNRFKNIFAKADFQPDVVNAVLSYQDAIFVASDKGLNVIKGGKAVENHPLAQRLENKRVRHLLVDSKNNLWTSTYSEDGLIKYTEKGAINKFNLNNGLISDRVRLTLESQNGQIYVGTRDGLSIIKDDRVVKSLTVNEGLANPQVLCLLEHNGLIYVGTDGGGISVIKDGEIVDTIDGRVGLPNGVVLRMAKDPQNDTIWIATNTALAYYENGKVKKLDKFEGSNNFDIIFTDKDNMLITCNKGFYVTNRELLKEGKYSQVLTGREGLNGTLTPNSFNYHDNKGNVYLCLQNGLDKINLQDIFKSDINLKLTIPSVKLDGKEYFFSKLESIKVPSSVDSISFRGYIVSHKLDDAHIAVKLEGYDKDFRVFSRFKNQDCVYNNLPGGQYKIKIGIIDPQTNVVGKTKTYTLIKEHRWSEYKGTIATVGLLLVIGGFLLYRSKTGKRIKQLITKQKETEKFLDEVIDAFAKAIDLKDHYTRGHSDRVADYSKLIALEMGLGEAEAEKIHRIGKLHDVGKVVVPESVLNKPGRLTDEEFKIMKEHTDNGYKILANITSFPHIAIGAKTHHERYDGHGYCHGLAGKDIPLEGRIIAVADTFDAMNSTRVYRSHLTKEKIIQELEKAKDTQLDAKIVEIMLRLIAEGKVTVGDNNTPPQEDVAK